MEVVGLPPLLLCSSLLLERSLRRLEWEKAREREAREVEDEKERERLVMQAIDW